MTNLDVVVPVKNEEKNIRELIQRISYSLSGKGIIYNILAVVDPSTDRTLEILKELSRSYPIIIHKKMGKTGKGYSLIEGFSISNAEFLAYIDADLQYPPEIIPEMLEKLKDPNYGVITANRKTYTGSSKRSIGSKINKTLIGKHLLRFNVDIQSGLKVFKREIFDHMDCRDIGPWTFDVPLLHTAKELGYKFDQVDIDFSVRKEGVSNIEFVKTAFSIISNALKIKFKENKVYHHPIDSHLIGDHIGSSVTYKGKRYVIHSRLHHSKSSIYTFKRWQKITLLGIFFTILAFLFMSPLQTGIVIIGILSAIYFFDVLFTLYLTLKSLHFPPEIISTKNELDQLEDSDLPIYTVMCPLYKESRVVGQYVESMKKLEWPKDKLEVLLLFEEGDEETIEASNKLNLPDYVKVLIVPKSSPKTKPKACNYGLHHAKGEYTVVFDAEDKPDPMQLKKAYLAFQKVDSNVVCIQAKLNYYNTHQNFLTRMFTAEYSLWFDIILPGLQSIDTIIPLGGTSNHFRTKNLIQLEGWDSFNVTEDCDLGVRLFKQGYKTAIIDSTTYEEANSNVKNWIRQRSRWIKGYLQTYFVHMRDPIKFLKEYGYHALLFQLIIGIRISFILINPILWLTTISYFVFYKYVGATIESLYPTFIFYMAGFSLVFGNFLYLYNYMIGLAKKEKWSIIKFVFFVPFYWLMMSLGAVVAFYQLIVRPHYWEKTIHGLHLKPSEKPIKTKRLAAIWTPVYSIKIVFSSIQTKLLNLIRFLFKHKFAGAGILIISSFFENVFNFLYNAFLGRTLRVEDFGLISLFGSFLFLVKIPSSAIARTVTYETAFYFGKYKHAVKDFWVYVRRKSILYSSIFSIIWLVSIPFLKSFFNSDSTLPFILFTPVWFIGIVSSVDLGFVSGNLMFAVLAVLAITYSLGKFLFSFLFVTIGQTNLVYAATPAAMFISFLIGWYYANSVKKTKLDISQKEIRKFPIKFLFSSTIIKISEIAFFTLDVILAKHFLSPREAGEYALVSLVGKMIFFIGGLFGQFILPLVSKEEGAKGKSKVIFYKLLFVSTAISLIGYLFVGVFGKYTGPILFGPKILPVVYLLPLYGLAMLGFQIADNIISFEQARSKHVFAIVSLILAVSQVIGLSTWHGSLKEFVFVMTVIGVANFLIMLSLHFTYDFMVSVVKYIRDAFILFGNTSLTKNIKNDKRTKVLILNWRDTKHIWAGGAEVYTHEVAKRLVKKGYVVIQFCGNDRQCPIYEEIDGVKIVRKGGLYTFYFWAALFYIFKLRKHIDIIIDSHNVIPFFSPLYTRKPVICLIHHVHQEVFKSYLPKPLATLACFLEAKIMPLVYRNSQFVTVSESSKKDIINLGFKRKDIEIVNPGIDIEKFTVREKTEHPSILYLGRLKSYKSIDVLIKTMVKVIGIYPDTKLRIAGFGDNRKDLEKLVQDLGLTDSVEFLGKVSEEEKMKYMGESWLFAYPSSMEGWGISVIEANACGTPVIASNVPGLRDSVSNPHSGILVSYGNVDEFSQVIINLFGDKNTLKKMSKDAIKWSHNFDWNNSANLFSKIIDKNVKRQRKFKKPYNLLNLIWQLLKVVS